MTDFDTLQRAIGESRLTLNFCGIWEQLLDRFNKPTAAAIVGLLRQKTFTAKLSTDATGDVPALDIVEIDGEPISGSKAADCGGGYKPLQWDEHQATAGTEWYRAEDHSKHFAFFIERQPATGLWSIISTDAELLQNRSPSECLFIDLDDAKEFCESINRAAWDYVHPATCDDAEFEVTADALTWQDRPTAAGRWLKIGPDNMPRGLWEYAADTLAAWRNVEQGCRYFGPIPPDPARNR